MSRRVGRGPGVAMATVALGAVVVLAGGAAAGLVLAPDRVPASVRAAESAGTAPVSTQAFDDARQVAVTPQVALDVPLTLADQGRVTASSCAPGGQIGSGSSPARIDDRPVVALATSVPLWRDLGPGVKGDDVRSLQVELARLGFDVVADGTYGSATKAAVTRLFKDAGVVKPAGVLPVASVLWLPEASVTVKECGAPVGATVAGTDSFVTVAGGLTSLTLPESVSGGAPGDRVVRYGDVTATVGADGTVTDANLLAAVAAGPEFAGWQRTEGQQSVMVTYALATPLDVTVVPPGALFALTGTSGCVVGDGQARPVQVVSSSLGQTMVAFDGAAPSSVALTTQDGRTTCD